MVDTVTDKDADFIIVTQDNSSKVVVDNTSVSIVETEDLVTIVDTEKTIHIVESIQGPPGKDFSDITLDPTGFQDRTNTVISFDDNTRTFSISPSSGETFTYYWKGNDLTKVGTQSVVIPDVEGQYIIQFNGSVLEAISPPPIDIIGKVLVAYIYWDATNKKHVIFGEERHGLNMDGMTHYYLHHSKGTVFGSGFNASGYTTEGNGSQDTHVQIGIAGGVIFDEDIEIAIADSDTPTDEFEQTLTPLNAPILYRDGSLGNWRKIDPTAYPVNMAATRPYYNEYTGAIWQRTEASNNSYIAMWIFATNDVNDPVMAVMGQREDNNLDNAKDNNLVENLDMGTFPTLEFRLLYRLIYQVRDAYSNQYNCALRDVLDLRQADYGTSGFHLPSAVANGGEEVPYAKQINEVSGDYYIGEAEPGSLTSDPVWRIKKVDFTGDDSAITWADGNSNFDNIWDDHLSLSYS